MVGWSDWWPSRGSPVSRSCKFQAFTFLEILKRFAHFSSLLWNRVREIWLLRILREPTSTKSSEKWESKAKLMDRSTPKFKQIWRQWKRSMFLPEHSPLKLMNWQSPRTLSRSEIPYTPPLQCSMVKLRPLNRICQTSTSPVPKPSPPLSLEVNSLTRDSTPHQQSSALLPTGTLEWKIV